MFRFFLILGLLAGSAGLAQEARPRSTVFYATDEQALSGYEENPHAVEKMVNSLVLAVTGQKEIGAAWKTLVKPGDRVGIKVSAQGGQLFSTHQGVVTAIVAGLLQAGIGAQNIVVWDRADMAAAGFSRQKNGCSVETVEPFIGYDVKTAVTAPIMGKLIWGDAQFTRKPGAQKEPEPDQLSDESHWSRVLGQVTKIINAPVFCSEENCGVAGCLYNVTIPNLDNWRRFTQSPDPTLADLYHDDHAGPKVVLNLMDGLIAQFAGGPDFQPNYAWNHGTIYASKDPVAIDATALRNIDAWRAQAHLPPLAAKGSYLETAASMGLGQAAGAQIELKKVDAP